MPHGTWGFLFFGFFFWKQNILRILEYKCNALQDGMVETLLPLMALAKMLLTISGQRASPCDLWAYRDIAVPLTHQPHEPWGSQHMRGHVNFLLVFTALGHWDTPLPLTCSAQTLESTYILWSRPPPPPSLLFITSCSISR